MKRNKFVFFGLGNNESQYLNTKHNAGRIILEHMAQIHNLHWKSKDTYHYTKSEDDYYLFSSGYMNTSGSPLQQFSSYFDIDWSEYQLVIIQDDSDQISGNMKFVQAGGSAGHRGIDSIYRHLLTIGLDTSRVWRWKIGIRPEGNTLKSESFVLSTCSKQELEWYQSLAHKLDTGLKTSSTISKLQTFLLSKPIEKIE